MFYMARADNAVGVRELRQNLSVYLRRVKQGERLEVTERGQPVAILAPLPKTGSTLDRLIAEGLATPATGDLLDLPPPVKLSRKQLLAFRRALKEQWEDRF